jgi:hypothetical protein
MKVIIIIVLLVIVVISLVIYKFIKSNYKSANHHRYPLLDWNIDDLGGEHVFAPWSEVMSSTIVTPDKIKLKLDENNNVTIFARAYTPQAISTVKQYHIDDIIIVYWRSSPESWRRLAGSAGYVLISKSERKQVDFISTVMS